MKKTVLFAAVLLILTSPLTSAFAGDMKIKNFIECGEPREVSIAIEKRVNELFNLIETSKVEKVTESQSFSPLSNIICLSVSVTYRD